MKSRKSVVAIERVFDESSKTRKTEKELDQSLEDIGVRPETLVASGLNRIKVLLDKSKEVISMSSKYPIAASKKKADIAALKEDLMKTEEEEKTSKKK